MTDGPWGGSPREKKRTLQPLAKNKCGALQVRRCYMTGVAARDLNNGIIVLYGLRVEKVIPSGRLIGYNLFPIIRWNLLVS